MPLPKPVETTVLEGRSPQSERWLDPVMLHDLLETLQPSHIVLGPGPGHPNDAHLTMALAHHALAGQLNVPVLGVCLGHQALALADGRRIAPLRWVRCTAYRSRLNTTVQVCLSPNLHR